MIDGHPQFWDRF